LKPAQIKKIQTLAVRTFRTLELSGMARVDFFLEKKGGKLYLNEVNTIPGFTSISMYPKLWEATGIPFRELIDRLITLALEVHGEKARTKYQIELPEARPGTGRLTAVSNSLASPWRCGCHPESAAAARDLLLLAAGVQLKCNLLG